MVGGHVGGLNEMTIWNKLFVQEIQSIVDHFVEQEEPDSIIDNSKLIDSICQKFSLMLDSKIHGQLIRELSSQFSMKKIAFKELMVFLEPYLHSTLNCLEYNLKPLIPIKLNSFLEQTKKFISHRGIDYNLMIIGRSGSGKSSLLDTIFNCAVSRKHNDMQIADAPQLPESCIVRSVRHVIEENDLRIRLCIYDTPGYGDLIDNTNCIVPITTKIKDLYNMHMRKEESIERDPSNLDDRIHCCLYVIPPTGHRLSSLDVKCLQQLAPIVNLIPIIGRADSLNSDELKAFQTRIKVDLMEHKINCYPFTMFPSGPKGLNAENNIEQMADRLPLAAIGANFYDNVQNKVLRKTSHGDIDILDPNFSDMPFLNDILICKQMLNLIQTTDKIFYESHRRMILKSLSS